MSVIGQTDRRVITPYRGYSVNGFRGHFNEISLSGHFFSFFVIFFLINFAVCDQGLGDQSNFVFCHTPSPPPPSFLLSVQQEERGWVWQNVELDWPL